MKRIISYILILTLLVVGIPAAAAKTDGRIYLQTGYGVAGEKVSVDVYVDDFKPCIMYGLIISYDPAVLEPISYTDKQQGQLLTSEVTQEGVYGVVWLDDMGDSRTLRDDALVGTLNFKVLSKAKAGSTAIKIMPKSQFVHSSEAELNVTRESCRMVVYKNHPFSDVKNEWFKESVLFVYNNGLMEGTGDHIFAPEDVTTRAQMVTVLYRMENKPKVKGKTPFTDLTQSWYKDAVLWAYQTGITTGTTKTTFAPNEPVTREQIAAIFYRYAKYKKADTSTYANLSYYPDAKQVSDYAKKPIAWACSQGIINGIKQLNGKITLSPKGDATRAQIATILMRYIKVNAES